jgi:hypothetical protein
MKFGADIGGFEKSHVNIASGGDTSKVIYKYPYVIRHSKERFKS